MLCFKWIREKEEKTNANINLTPSLLLLLVLPALGGMPEQVEIKSSFIGLKK